MNITATHEIFVIFESKIQFPKGEETAREKQLIHIKSFIYTQASSMRMKMI